MKNSKIFVVSDDAGRFSDLLSGACSLSDDVVAVYYGDEAGAGDVWSYGAKGLVLLPPQAEGIFENQAPTVAKLVEDAEAAMIFLPSGARGKALAAMLGARLSAPVFSDISSLTGNLCATRMVYGGLAVAQEKACGQVCIVTIPLGVFEARECGGAKGSVSTAAYIAPERPIRKVGSEPVKASSVNIGLAKKVVGVGRGFAQEKDLALAQALAEAIGAELACSRPIAEGEHWMERERYVGVSGAVLKGDIYVACGISGQVQHMVGADDCKTIAAINKDKNAPIFKYADYGIVGDLYKVLPELAKLLRQ